MPDRGPTSFRLPPRASKSPARSSGAPQLPRPMRVVPVLILALLAAPFALAQDNATGNQTATPTATPTEAGPITFNVQGHADGTDYYWTVEGQNGHNPTLSVPPGAKVTFHVSSVSGVHNFKVGSEKVSDVINEGESVDAEWTAPASGEATYICEIHGAAMSGKIRVGAATGGAPAPAAQATPAPTAITVIAHADGSDYYWTVEGVAGKNPTLVVAPDADITVTVKNSGDQTHNFGVGVTDKASDYVNTAADVVTFTFHSGAEGQSSEYFCVPHKGLGMKGVLKFAKEIAPAPSGGGGDLTGNINGGSTDLGQFDPACAGMTIPDASANKEIGGPTIPDYVQRCKDIKAGVQTDSEARAPSNADYVIPISIVLIALGIVGVVWVHKFYKP